MFKTHKIGDQVWTCLDTDESRGYGNHLELPNEPRLVKITEDQPSISRCGTNICIAQGFDQETGETDDDPNATYRGDARRFHATEAEALVDYLELLRILREQLQQRCNCVQDIITLTMMNPLMDKTVIKMLI